MTICAQPGCQTTVGCVCQRVYTPPFTPGAADVHYSAEIGRLKKELEQARDGAADSLRMRKLDLESELSQARNDAFEDAAQAAEKIADAVIFALGVSVVQKSAKQKMADAIAEALRALKADPISFAVSLGQAGIDANKAASLD